MIIPKSSENKPRGLYFSKALFEGLVLEGLIYGGKFAFQKNKYLEGNLRLQIDWAGLYLKGHLCQ